MGFALIFTGAVVWAVVCTLAILALAAFLAQFVEAAIFTSRVVRAAGWKGDPGRLSRARMFLAATWRFTISPPDCLTTHDGVVINWPGRR